MKRYLIALFLLLSACLYSEEFRLIKSDVIFQEHFFPLDEGSEKQEDFLVYLEKFCLDRGLKYKRSKIEGDDYSSNSYNFRIDIKGKGASGEKCVFIFPLNSIYINQELVDFSFSLQVGLELIDEALNYTFDKDLVFLFSGANGREGEEALGLVNYLEEAGIDRGQSFVNLVDIGNLPSRITFTGSLNERPVPALVLKNYLKSKPRESGVYFNPDEIQKARFRLLVGYERLGYFSERDVVAVAFKNVDNRAGSGGYIDEAQRFELVEYFINWLILFDTVELYKNIDYNYKFLDLPGYKLVISEVSQIIFYLITLLILISVRSVVAYSHRQRVKLIISIFPYFIGLFLLYFILSYLPRQLSSLLGYFFGGEGLYRTNPGLYMFNSFLIPLLIIYILFELINRLPFPKHNYLYIYGAVIFSYINLLLFTIFDISLTYVYMWTVLFFTLSHFTGKNFGLKYFVYLLSAIPLVKLFYDLLIAGNIELVREAVANPYLLNLTFCLFTFPYLLIAIRVYLINRNKFKILPSKLAHAIILFVVIVLSLLYYSLTSLNRVGEEKVVVGSYIKESSRGNSRLELSSEMGLGSLQIEESGLVSSYNYEEKDCSIQINSEHRPYSYKISEEKLDFSRRLRLAIESEKEPDALELFLVCPDKINPLASNYRFLKVEDSEFNREGNDVYKLLIPKRPGNNPVVDFELLPMQSYEIRLKLSYLGLDETIGLSIKSDRLLIKSYYKEKIALEL